MVVELVDLGFDSFFEKQLKAQPCDRSRLARIASEHRGGYDIWSSESNGKAKLPKRLLREFNKEGYPGVGDWVVLKAPASEVRETTIERLLTRKTEFVRGASGREVRPQTVAANVDLVFAVTGLDDDYNVRRIERFLARIWASGAKPMVILNKVDICDDTATRVAEVKNRCLNVPVFVTSALSGKGLDEIRELIKPGLTAAFVGSSGTGKSSLVNGLLGEQRMATGQVRAQDSKGRHTTSRRQLIILPGGGLLLDTPGMRELQMLFDDGISTVFADIEELAGQCRFSNCTHDSEPECAIKQAIDTGKLSGERFDHYSELDQEAQVFEQRHTEHQRRKSQKTLSKMVSQAVQNKRRKRD